GVSWSSNSLPAGGLALGFDSVMSEPAHADGGAPGDAFDDLGDDGIGETAIKLDQAYAPSSQFARCCNGGLFIGHDEGGVLRAGATDKAVNGWIGPGDPQNAGFRRWRAGHESLI